MRIYPASASAAVTRTLDAIIDASGHTRASTAEDAELILTDPHHPSPVPETSAPQLVLSTPATPYQVMRQLASWQGAPHWNLAGGWQLDISARALIHGAQPPVALTEKETRLLAVLAGAHPTPLAREALLVDVWGMRGEIDTHTLETHIYRLRQKLESATPTPCDIATENGAYRLVLET